MRLRLRLARFRLGLPVCAQVALCCQRSCGPSECVACRCPAALHLPCLTRPRGCLSRRKPRRARPAPELCPRRLSAAYGGALDGLHRSRPAGAPLPCRSGESVRYRRASCVRYADKTPSTDPPGRHRRYAGLPHPSASRVETVQYKLYQIRSQSASFQRGAPRRTSTVSSPSPATSEMPLPPPFALPARRP
jgi:hypothetical protein